MLIYYPSYYKDFKCIADSCRHSCCVGWEICVDDGTMKKYRSLPEAEGEGILSHIGDGGCMMLADGERCPFLCDDGLCRLISTYGEGYISHICCEHPRFYHRAGDRIECGLGASCEAACKIILTSDFGEFYYVKNDSAQIADETDFDSLTHREKIYTVLSDENLSYPEKINRIKNAYSICDSIFKSESLTAALDELEYLDEAHREVIKLGKDGREELCTYYERFFAYLLFRHLSVAEHYDDLRARLGFCLLLLSIFENATSCVNIGFEEICERARIISEEIEYSEDNTASLIFEINCLILPTSPIK